MKNSELEFGQRVVDARRDIDHEAIGEDPLGDRLAADKGFMRGGNVEHPRVDEIGNSKLPKDGGAS